MTQEVHVTLKLDVGTSQSKKDIEKFLNGLINTHTLRSSIHNRLIYSDIQIKEIKEIKEEAEIYDVEENSINNDITEKLTELFEYKDALENKMKYILLWGKTKDGKFNFDCSEEMKNELQQLLNDKK